jgi:hypothetical protein
MLVTNGKVTRNITASQLPEYEGKGYKEVKTPEKPKTAEKGKK